MAGRPEIRYIQFYTDGSAARKLEPVRSAPKQTVPKPRKRKRKVVYVDPVASLGIIVAVAMLVMMAVGVAHFASARQENLQMEQYVQQLTQENAELNAQYAAGYDLKSVERTAMALGMVPAGQVEHITIQITAQEPDVEPVTLWDRIGTFLSGLFA